MGKRSNFARVDRDLYRTPYSAAKPLFPHLPPFGGTFYEPCAADGLLISHFDGFMVCIGASDIVPLAPGVRQKDFFELTPDDINGADLIITNPPWKREILHCMIKRLQALKVPAWLLFDADWQYTKQSAPYMPYCAKVVAVGRVKWFGNKAGKDNAAWYLFMPEKQQRTLFYGRT